MYEPNGSRPRPHQTRKRGAWSKFANAVRMNLPALPPPVRLLIAIALCVLIGLLLGCATPSTPPSETPRVPSKPAPQQSQPTEPYLERVRRNIESWEQQLRATLPMP